MTKGSLDLLEFLWIFLATNSFPEPVGPEINILLSEVESFSIIFFTLIIAGLFPINSNEWNNLSSIISFSFLSEADSKPLYT